MAALLCRHRLLRRVHDLFHDQSPNGRNDALRLAGARRALFFDQFGMRPCCGHGRHMARYKKAGGSALIETLLIALLGSVGALVRYHLGGFVHTSANRALASEADFPYGTLFVNALGSLILGLIAGFFSRGMFPHLFYVVVGVGFCGSLTTFSTLAVDLQRFLRDGRFSFFALYLIASATSGLGATLLGLAVTRIMR